MPMTHENIREPNSAMGWPWGNASLPVRYAMRYATTSGCCFIYTPSSAFANRK